MRAPSLLSAADYTCVLCLLRTLHVCQGGSGRFLDEMLTILPKRPRSTVTVAYLVGWTGASMVWTGCRRSASHRPRIRLGARAVTLGCRSAAAIDHKEKSPTMQEITQQSLHDSPRARPASRLDKINRLTRMRTKNQAPAQFSALIFFAGLASPVSKAERLHAAMGSHLQGRLPLFRDEPRVTVLGAGQTIADRVPRSDPGPARPPHVLTMRLIGVDTPETKAVRARLHQIHL